jgi:hypothetical protein
MYYLKHFLNPFGSLAYSVAEKFTEEYSARIALETQIHKELFKHFTVTKPVTRRVSHEVLKRIIINEMEKFSNFQTDSYIVAFEKYETLKANILSTVGLLANLDCSK